MTVAIRQGNEDDVVELAKFAAHVFTENFGHQYHYQNLHEHLSKTCSPHYFRQSLANGDTLLLLEENKHLIGYAKAGHLAVPAPTPPSGSQEVHRVYVAKSKQGRGFGKQLMLGLLSLPQVQVAPMVYLGVWEENRRAQALYSLHGFKPIGHYLYYVGNQADREMIMARARG